MCPPLHTNPGRSPTLIASGLPPALLSVTAPGESIKRTYNARCQAAPQCRIPDVLVVTYPVA